MPRAGEAPPREGSCEDVEAARLAAALPPCPLRFRTGSTDALVLKEILGERAACVHTPLPALPSLPCTFPRRAQLAILYTVT